MPETIENEVPVLSPAKKRNERTEAKFFEDVDKFVAEAERIGAAYDPPGEIARLVNLKPKRTATLARRTVHQANTAAEETSRNARENLFKPLNGDVTSLVEYAKAAGKPANDIDALKSIAREIKGARAKAIDPNDTGNHISVAHLSYVSRADNYARFIEQYDSLKITTGEDMYKTATHRAKLAALQQATAAVIEAESNSNTSGELLDKLAYTDADSLLNGCLSGKAYIKSKYKNDEPFKNISKLRLDMPSRLRKNKK